jgi:hypothetical protein
MGRRGRAILHAQLQKVLIDLIAERIQRQSARGRKETMHVPAQVLAQYIASTFVLLLNWWLESGSRLSPKQADAVFRELVLPTLNALCRSG